jgi:hypothetical protein
VQVVVDDRPDGGCFADVLSARGAVRDATGRRADARKTLDGSVGAIVGAARVYALRQPGVDRRFRLAPRGGDRSLVAWGRAFLADAQPIAAGLLDNSLSPDVLTNLPAQIAALDKAMADQRTGRDKARLVHISLRTVRRSCAKTMSGLDAIARNAFRSDAEKLAGWKQSRRRGPSAVPPVPSLPTPPAPQATTDTKVA